MVTGGYNPGLPKKSLIPKLSGFSRRLNKHRGKPFVQIETDLTARVK
jgi:hypothetical protein